MPSTLRRIDDPHDATIAPDIIPADWAGHAPQAPANDAISREKLFAEIRHAAETAAPAVDSSFRATDVIPARKKSSRAWIRSAATAFAFALISAFAAAAWKHHGDAATEAAASWVPLLGASSSPAGDTSASGQQTADTAAQPATDQPADAAQPASSVAAVPPEAEQQIQSMARDLAAQGQQIQQLKATIEALKANQQVAVAPPPPVARAPAPKPKVSALPPRAPAPPPAYPPRPAYSPAVQASAAPPPPAPAAGPQAYPAPPPAYTPPPQATVQPNGEPVVRPPMPMPLSDRY
jgi:hypothetical protein